MADAGIMPVGGGEPELAIARDLAKRAVWVLPLFLAVSWLIWRTDGALSTAFAMAVVVVNFLAAAFMNSRAARISPAVLGAVALFGFLIRLGLVFIAFFLAKDAPWFEVVPFGLTVVVTHLGLLFWEMNYVSASLAFPGLKPTASPSLAHKEP
jgi:CDP-diglyceride synthetase